MREKEGGGRECVHPCVKERVYVPMCEGVNEK